MAIGEINDLNNNIFTIIEKLKRQSKRADTDSIHSHLIKTSTFQNTDKETLRERIDFLINQGKIINKINRNKDSFWINEELVDINSQLSISNMHNFTLNTPTIPRSNCLLTPLNSTSNNHQSTSLVFDHDNINTPTNTNISNIKEISDKNTNTVRNEDPSIKESEVLIDSMFEKLKLENIKNEIVLETEATIEKLFTNEMCMFKKKCEQLVQSSYENSKRYTEFLKDQIKQKDELIEKLL